MNMDFAQLSPEEREQALIAFILGELPAVQADQVAQRLTTDKKLAAELARLKQTMSLIREMNALDRGVNPEGVPLRLNDERRQQLLHKIRQPIPERRKRPLLWFPASLAAALVGLLGLALFLPGLAKSKARPQRVAKLAAAGNASDDYQANAPRKGRAQGGAEPASSAGEAEVRQRLLRTENETLTALDTAAPTTQPARPTEAFMLAENLADTPRKGLTVELPKRGEPAPNAEGLAGVGQTVALRAEMVPASPGPEPSLNLTTAGQGPAGPAVNGRGNDSADWFREVGRPDSGLKQNLATAAGLTKGYIQLPNQPPAPPPAVDEFFDFDTDNTRSNVRFGNSPATPPGAAGLNNSLAGNTPAQLSKSLADAKTPGGPADKNTLGYDFIQDAPQAGNGVSGPLNNLTALGIRPALDGLATTTAPDNRQSQKVPSDNSPVTNFGGVAITGNNRWDESFGLATNAAVGNYFFSTTERSGFGNNPTDLFADFGRPTSQLAANAPPPVASKFALGDQLQIEAGVLKKERLGESKEQLGREADGDSSPRFRVERRSGVQPPTVPEPVAAQPAQETALARKDRGSITLEDTIAPAEFGEAEKKQAEGKGLAHWQFLPKDELSRSKKRPESELAELAEVKRAASAASTTPALTPLPAVEAKIKAEPKEEMRQLVEKRPGPTPQPEVATSENPFSTFSLNVSDVSFKLAAASLEKGRRPDPAGIRSEEFLNAFDYRDPVPAPGTPVAFAWERARHPFAQNRDVLRFSVKTAAQGREAQRPLNLVLVIDNSGSMERADRVQIVKEALRTLAGLLQPQDKLSIITFSRQATLRVDGVAGPQAPEAVKQVTGLTPEGGTNLEEALDLAYRTALRHYQARAGQRVVLLTDGAANLGNVDPKTLQQKVENYRRQGVALDCFGIGWEGLNDDLLEQLTRRGDGRYGFINTPEEAATSLAGQLAGALRVAAADVKVQVEFNPQRVKAYRQVGYARHQLTKEQFRDNKVDAAELGAAEAGNGLYVIEVDPKGSGPLATVRTRFRVPESGEYRELEWVVPYGSAVELAQSGPALRLATSAATFAEWLAGSPYAAEATPDRLLGLLTGVPELFGADPRPRQLEWMLRQARSLGGN